ncbi:UNVERIFIED_CONTAM: hypothetical protein Scaly_1099500 [Sesamum calycinum]|uniref:RNase H type-1 domain-containing protein n=1 Tax=Sesamum calycinum TaxID=2727403 RepID=A0AAW2QM43_9LAMI
MVLLSINDVECLSQVAKPFLEPKTANKVKFVYSDDPNTNKIMDDLFEMELVESAFGGKDDADFDVTKYAERMREDDKKIPLFWKPDGSLAATPLPVVTASPSLETTNSETESDESDVKVEKSSSPGEEDDARNPVLADWRIFFKIAGAWWTLTELNAILLQHCYREANKLADLLAQSALSSAISKSFGQCPMFVFLGKARHVLLLVKIGSFSL